MKVATGLDIFHTTPLLHGVGTTGEPTQWQGFAAEGNDGVVIFTEFGRVGGTIQRSKPSIVDAKNIGRSNETTLRDQAISQIDSKCTKKQKEGYKPQGVAAAPAMLKHQERILPMLAPSEIYPHHVRHLTWPLLGQPKLDGMRLVTDGQDFWSRKGELQNEANIRHLRHDTKGLLIDGEVLLPPDVAGFQTSMSAIKDAKNADARKLVYCVFDIVDLTRPFHERYELLREFLKANPHPSWALVATVELADDAAARKFFATCLDKGMEGIMLRNREGRYRPKARSRDLQKFKSIDDDEFTIVGYKEAKGGWSGTPVFRLVTNAANKPAADGSTPRPGVEFEAKPKMSLSEAQQLWADRDALIGKQATVLFQGYYDQKADDDEAGKPRFPRLKTIRDYD